ncbi:MAG: Holliday junction branch migration protein RuvA [Rhodospirillales bacterium]|nr:Holliday junction branch migration protein RuvA [Rhodospirillales bacterium]MBO6787479.1 Holliday junction branch migration protein RuvA [Rhodospirillales bacterium]
MIARLKGIVEDIGDDWAVVDVNGVGYLVFASGRTLGRLAVGEAAVIYIETHVREDHIHLYGFADTLERDWFKLLTTVQGVGAKVGLAIQSVLSNDEVSRAILSGDKGAITRAPGVGPKLAARIIAELKDKVGTIALGQNLKAEVGHTATASAGGAQGAVSDAVSALVNLGYSPSQALGVVSEAAGELGEAADVGVLIKAGLSKLAPADQRAGARR